jgi:hypothetical protein
MAVDLNRLIAPEPPNLPVGTEQYERRYMDQFGNVLRLYFNRLTNALQALFGTAGGKLLSFPYGAFKSTASQTATANTATLLTLNTTDYASEVSLVSPSKIKVENSGMYNLQFSVQVENYDNAPQDIYIWLKKGNGATITDIVGSTGVIGLPARKNVSDPAHTIAGWNYFISMTKDDFIQIYWSTTHASMSIPAYAASGTPTKPSTASVVATLTFVSEIPS